MSGDGKAAPGAIGTRIWITLPADRRRPGELCLMVDGMIAIRGMDCLGKADNAMAAVRKNAERNPVLPYGDTPAGTYKPLPAREYDPPHKRMGRWAIPLLGIAGQARDAMVLRTGLAIHGGRGDGRLFATHGCIRLRDRDMAMLVAKLDGRAPAIEIEQLPEEKPEKETV